MTTKTKPVPKDAKKPTAEEKEALAQWEAEAAKYAEAQVAAEEKASAEANALEGAKLLGKSKGYEPIEEPARFRTGGATYDEIQAWRAVNQQPQAEAKEGEQ